MEGDSGRRKRLAGLLKTEARLTVAKKVHKMCLRWAWGLDMIRHVRKDTRGSQEEKGCMGGKMETGSPWRAGQ